MMIYSILLISSIIALVNVLAFVLPSKCFISSFVNFVALDLTIYPVKDSFRIYKTILKFSGSSFVSFLLDYVLFNIFNALLGLIPYFNAVFFSNIFARIISCMFNYQLNKKYVFRLGGGVQTAVKYFCLALGILIANTVLLQAFTALGIPAFAGKILTEITLFICSMLVQRFMIFKNAESH